MSVPCEHGRVIYCPACIKITHLERDLAAANERAEKFAKCETCDGSGLMEVCVRVTPPDGREEYEEERCAECDGTGIGHFAATILENARLRAEVERIAEENRLLRGGPDEQDGPCSPYHQNLEECPTLYDGCNCTIYNLLGVREQLAGANERLTREIKTMCKDWAHDHTEMQNKVRQFVPGADVEGDSYGVPGILDLADILTMHVTVLTRERDEAVALLRKTQWSDTAHGFGGSTAPRCQECGGIHPNYSLNTGGGKYMKGEGHRAGCTIGALLARIGRA